MPSAGKLYVVSTPIGNLGDMSFRAIETLKSVDLIASEDTRHTGLLLKHYGIATKQFAYHEHNERRVADQLIEKIKQGQNIALVTDAGTPAISDPGFYLVRECLRNAIEIVPIPGASSLLAALVISGMPVDRFCFEGFLPKTSGRLITRLNELKEDRRTLIFFESPQRILKTLKAILETVGDRQAFIGRELTKKFEQTYRMNISQLIEIFEKGTPKGELVLIVRGHTDSNTTEDEIDRNASPQN
jgi:16S rRNA (cytidine1402-2'-O)-methyltransferase